MRPSTALHCPPGLTRGEARRNTYFWIDPAEELIAILMTQYMPFLGYPTHSQLETATYQALVG